MVNVNLAEYLLGARCGSKCLTPMSPLREERRDRWGLPEVTGLVLEGRPALCAHLGLQGTQCG